VREVEGREIGEREAEKGEREREREGRERKLSA
jgi:hypothetical protein